MEVERSIQHICLSQEELSSLIHNAFPQHSKLDKWEILSGGALNTIYKLQIDQQAYVLRIYSRDRAHCKTEKMIHQLIDGQVSTPKLVYADELHEPWAYSIFEFVSGKHISEVSYENEELLSYELGRVLALIHSFKLPQAGLFGDGMTIKYPFTSGSNPYFEETFSVLTNGKNIRHRLGNQLTDKTLEFIQANKSFFPIVGEDVSLTHSDFKPVNLLYSAGTVFVLDWEFAHAGMGILDFAVLLRYRDQFPLDLIALAKGYTDCGRILPRHWFPSALITDFLNIVQLLESPPERPKLFDQLKNVAQKTINDWESLQSELNIS